MILRLFAIFDWNYPSYEGPRFKYRMDIAKSLQWGVLFNWTRKLRTVIDIEINQNLTGFIKSLNRGSSLDSGLLKIFELILLFVDIYFWIILKLGTILMKYCLGDSNFCMSCCRMMRTITKFKTTGVFFRLLSKTDPVFTLGVSVACYNSAYCTFIS